MVSGNGMQQLVRLGGWMGLDGENGQPEEGRGLKRVLVFRVGEGVGE